MYEDFKEEIIALQSKVQNGIHASPVVFYGSSSFRLWDTLKSDLNELDILNLAFGGSNLGACTFYFNELFNNLNPERIIVYCGDNDVIDGFNKEKVLKDFKLLNAKIRSHYPDLPLTFVSIKPSPIKEHLIKGIQHVNREISKIIESLDHTDFLNIHDAMLTSSGNVNKDLFSEDDLHMNEKGYLLWKSLFRMYFEIN